MSELLKYRSVEKQELMKLYGNLDVLISEDDYDGVVSEREWMKAQYIKFRETHREYHETLQEESDIEVSDMYLDDAQKLYAKQQNLAKAALNEMRPCKPVKEAFHNEQSFQTLGQLINLPSLELKKFSGQPDEYDNFVTTFNEVIGSTLSDPASKLICLKSQLTGTALDSISMCRADGGEDGFTRAMNILHNRFGSPYIVCTSVIEHLKYGPDVRSPSELRTFSDELANAEVTLKNNNMFTEIDTQNNIIEICLRLECSLRFEWRKRVMKHKQSTGVYLSFSEFVIFMQEQADIVNDPLYGNDALMDRPARNRMKKSISSFPVVTHGTGSSTSELHSDMQLDHTSTPSIQCHLCLKNHKLYACYKFRNMPIDKRCAYVKTNNLCCLCLSKDHLVSECRSTYICRLNDCGKRHSSSLHVQDNQPPAVASNCVQTCETSNTYIPTVPVLINDTLQTFALLDTGSSASFCSKRLIKKMKLQCTNTSYKLRTLHGTNNNFSEIVNLRVSSRDGLSSLEMNNVIVVDEIPVERCSFDDVSRYPHLKDLTFAHASRVDLLIGQDNSAALMPMDVRHGPVGSPFAVLTKFGWSLNGRVSNNVPNRRVTSHLVTVQDVADHQQEEYNKVAYVHEETLKMFTDPNASDMTDSLYATFNRFVVVICLVWFFLSIMFLCLCADCLYGFTMGLVSFLEASHASMGGVLFQVYYVSHILPYCMYLLYYESFHDRRD